MVEVKAVVLKSHIKGSIDGNVRDLKRADMTPQVHLAHGQRPVLVVIRNGNGESLPISRRVAEELIAAGFGYGD